MLLTPNSSPPQHQGNVAKQSVNCNDAYQDTYPLPRPTRRIPIFLKHSGTPNHALVRQIRLIHALTPRATRVVPLAKLVNHHSLEYICLQPESVTRA